MMKVISFSFLVGVVFTILSVSAHAEDVIAIRYLNGYPPIGISSEWINLRISRTGKTPGVASMPKQDVDNFFDTVSSTLTSNKITNDWQLAIPDAPSIEITIEIDGHKLRLTSCHIPLEREGKVLVTEHGAVAASGKERNALLAKESDAFRRHRDAFEKILRLALERTHVRLS